MRSIAVVVLILMSVMASVTAVQAGDIFRYVTTEGTVSFTDSEKKIPMLYKPSAEEVVLGGAFQSFNRLTIVTVTPEIKIPVVVEEESTSTDTCAGAVTVTRERRQFEDFNRTVYLAHDECGNLISETFFKPSVKVGR